MAIKNNQLVSMQYELKINEEVIESNLNSESIEFVFGQGEVVPGLESRILDMNEGETREIKVPAKEAYGEYNHNLIEKFAIGDFEGIDLYIGLILEAENENNEIIKATVSDVTKDEVIMDYNHPLAGCDLDFKVVINKIA